MCLVIMLFNFFLLALTVSMFWLGFKIIFAKYLFADGPAYQPLSSISASLLEISVICTGAFYFLIL